MWLALICRRQNEQQFIVECIVLTLLVVLRRKMMMSLNYSHDRSAYQHLGIIYPYRKLLVMTTVIAHYILSHL